MNLLSSCHLKAQLSLGDLHPGRLLVGPAAGGPQFLADCQQEVSDFPHMGLSIGQLE